MTPYLNFCPVWRYHTRQILNTDYLYGRRFCAATHSPAPSCPER